jgi:glycosyltransferase involved in cell wall biosynthesis
VRRQQSQGAAAARNAGAAVARGQVLAFTDADCAPIPGWLRAGHAAVQSADFVQGRVEPVPDVPIGPFDRSLWVTSDHGLYESANVFMRRELFDQLGGFHDFLRADERHDGRWRRRIPTRPFGEDTWLGWRARRSGARIVFSDEALVHHAVLPGDARGYVLERVRGRLFPRLVREIPELREAFLWRRMFLHRRSAAFDVAAAGTLIALVARRPTALLATLPYAWLVRGETRRWGAHGVNAAKLACVVAVADAVETISLGAGMMETRTPVL